MSTYPVFASPTQLHSTFLAKEYVEVDEWQLGFWVWELTGAQLDEYRSGMYRTRGTKTTIDLRNTTARLLVYALRHEDGSAIFDNEAEGMHRLLGMGSAGLERLATVARRLSRMDEDDEDAEGNSAAAPSGSSSTTSPSPSATPSPTSSPD